MRALVRDVPLDRDLAPRLPLDALEQLAARLRRVRYGAVLHGPAGYADALALLALVRDLARIAHVVALPLRQDGNARGAEDVLAWQTGYPAAVSFARGHPRARPGEFSAAGLLERGETDAALDRRLRRAPPPPAARRRPPAPDPHDRRRPARHRDGRGRPRRVRDGRRRRASARAPPTAWTGCP